MQLLIELKNKGRIEDADALKEAGYSQEDIVDGKNKISATSSKCSYLI